jgi:hypothetical protein
MFTFSLATIPIYHVREVNTIECVVNCRRVKGFKRIVFVDRFKRKNQQYQI